MTFLKNLKVRTKFAVLIIVSLVASMLIGTYAYIQASNMAEDMEGIYEEKFIPNGWISDAIHTNLKIDSILIELMFIDDLAEKQKLQAEMNEGVEGVLENFAKYEQMDLSDAEKQQIAQFYEAVEALTGNQDRMIELALEGKNDEAYALFLSTVKDARVKLVEALHNLNDIKAEQTSEISTNNVTKAEQTGERVIFFMLAITIVLIGLGILLARTITLPIFELMRQIDAARKGDFTARLTYESNDEIGATMHSFNNMMDTLQTTLNNVQKSAIAVDDNAANLSANIQQSGATTEHVVSAVQEIAAGSEETKKSLEYNAIILDTVTSSVTSIQSELTTIEGIASQTLEAAKDGSTTVSENLTQMEKIQQSVIQSNDVISSLANQVGEVDKILNVINSISEQTNLLALNAAIEAARAGDHGKGFAVVADEVRKLAEQSLQSTKSISAILNSIQLDTQKTVTNMAIVLDEANKGLTTTNSSAKKFDEIFDGTNNIAPLVIQMAQTVEAMNTNLQKFVANADSILNIAINNAANSEEVSASTEQQMNATMYMQQSAEALANVASDLNDVLKQFKI